MTQLWILVPQPGIEPVPHSVEAQISNHCKGIPDNYKNYFLKEMNILEDRSKHIYSVLSRLC